MEARNSGPILAAFVRYCCFRDRPTWKTNMSAKKSAGKPGQRPSVTKAASRMSVGGPSRSRRIDDPLARHAADTQDLAAQTPYNPLKAHEFGHENAVSPPRGAPIAPPSPQVSASTLSETNKTAKTGDTTKGAAASLSGALGPKRADGGGQVLTTNQGVQVADNQNSLKAGLRGPALLEDFILREKITHFDHERIPERIVHARGSAAHGFFESYEALTDVTRAAPFAQAGKITPLFVRFSTVAGERGSVDTASEGAWP